MRFTCNVATLKRALALLKLDEPGTHLSMTGQAAQLQFRCYTDDGNFRIDHAIPVEVEVPGKATVPPDTLSRICNYAVGETLRFSHHEWHGCLDIEGNQHRHAVRTHGEKRQKPALAELADAPEYEVQAPQFGAALKSVLFASVQLSDSEEANRRPLITGALFHQHEGEERVVATDGRRMAMITLPLTNKPAVAETSVPMRAMPYAACMKMIDLVESLNPNVCHLRFTENAMCFQAEGVSLRCLLPKGDFPDYKCVFEKASSANLRVKVNREELLWALKVIRVGDDHPHNRTEFRVSDGGLTVENSTRVGNSKACVPIQYEGVDTAAAFDARFFEEALLQTDATEVTLWMRPPEPTAQMRLELAPNFQYVVMPMR